MAHFDLTDFEWSVIALLLPNKMHGVILAPNKAKASAAFRKARGILAGQKMDAYDPATR